MSRSLYRLSSEPRDATYDAIVNLLAQKATRVQVVRREQSGDAGAQEFLRSCAGDLEEVAESSEWPGTVLVGHTALVYRYRATPRLMGVLRSACRGLFEWQQPTLPEDLCAFRADGEVLLASIAHERDGWILLDAREFDALPEDLVSLLGLERG